MGDYKTAAAVTRAIAHVVREALARHQLLGEVDVTIASPHQVSANRGTRRKSINLFLYHVRPTPSLRNRDLPVYESERMVNVPSIGLDLYYLLSFYGAAPNDLEAERLLGLTVAALNAHPLLNQSDFVASAEPGEASSGIIDTVSVVPMTLTIEEMQRLWAMFPNVPYTLSMSYCASSALIVGDEIAAPQPPVASGGKPGRSPDDTQTQPSPVITSVAATSGANQPIVFGDSLRIQGRGLAAERVAVAIAGLRLKPTEVSADAITVALTDLRLRAGDQPLQVLQLDAHPAPGPLADARVRAASNELTVTLRPQLDSVTLGKTKQTATATCSGRLDLRVRPKPSAGQRAGIVLYRVGGGPSYAFSVDVNAFARGVLPAHFSDVPVGSYVVEFEIDGAASLLQPQSGQPYATPLIEIKAHA
jgi:hypothetical protein